MTDPAFLAEHKELATEFGHMLDMWSGEEIAKVKKNGVLEGRRLHISSESVPRGDKMVYESFVHFLPRGSTHEHPALAGFVYDEDYLRNSFFPQALKEVSPDQNGNDPSHPPPSIMIRKGKDQAPLAASLPWDGGAPEGERELGGFFQGLTLGIRPFGTTIA